MSQLLLDLALPAPAGFEDFVAGRNEELIGRLKSLADPFICNAMTLWGPAGCGKSHLLTATAREAAGQRPVLQLAGGQIGDELTAPAGALVIVDDLEALSPVAQVALFRLFNSARTMMLSMLLAAQKPPRELLLREDLRTRIGQTLIFEVKPLDDEAKRAALARHAQARGMPLSEELLAYLLHRAPRDLPTLLALLDQLDRASRQLKRPPTLPLLREVLQLGLALEDTRSPPPS